MKAKNQASKRQSAAPATPQQASVSLTMIVRNEERNLPLCLESVQGLFDEIVIVDTGSTDRTKEIATAFGGRVLDFPWIDDFAAARNVSLANATGDFVLWLDADDVIEPQQKGKLAALLKSLRIDTPTAYALRCICNIEGGAAQIIADQPRLFPRMEGMRWVYRIHEQIIPALHQARVPVVWTDVAIQHTGYADPVVHENKRQRNFRLLCRELAERPDDPFIYYYLGTLSFERKLWQEALGYFTVSLAKWGTTESIACKLYAMIAWTNQILTRYDESLRVCDEGLVYFPEDGELLFRKAVAQRYRRNTGDAEACWNRILTLPPPRKFYNVEPGIYGHLTRRNLATIAAERGDRVLATKHWKAILAECPNDPDATRNLDAAAQ
jgi:glycosyltransferase involved in cell wall biosynthesis